jgi:hypothetical protein
VIDWRTPFERWSSPNKRSSTAAPIGFFFCVCERVRNACGDAGAVGRLHDSRERCHEILLGGFQRCEVLGERRSEPVIGRGCGDRCRIEERQCHRIEFGDLEVIGPGSGPAERRLLHFVLQEIEVSVSSLLRAALQCAVDGAPTPGNTPSSSHAPLIMGRSTPSSPEAMPARSCARSSGCTGCRMWPWCRWRWAPRLGSTC